MRGNMPLRNEDCMDQDSFDCFDDMDEALVNSVNEISLAEVDSHAVNGQSNSANSATPESPKSIIVTNVDQFIFDLDDYKNKFESMFKEFDSLCTFHYLKSFRRIRVDFDSHVQAAEAKLHLDGTLVARNNIHCYFIQVSSPCNSDEAYLHVPPVERQFLISPPVSPPVGWQQPREDRPVMDYDLLSAMAQLSPGENHELHPARQVTMLGKSISTPSIVVQVCENLDATLTTNLPPPSRRIRNTRCPDRQSSLD